MNHDVALALGIVFVLLLLVLGWYRSATRIRRGNLRRLRRAQAGEAEAERLLEAAGWRVLDRQLTASWWLEVDGEPVEVRCRADLLVEAVRVHDVPRGHTYVADVKTGDRAPRPTLPATRRQLLEYRLVFEADGALVVDMRAGRIHRLGFHHLL